MKLIFIALLVGFMVSNPLIPREGSTDFNRTPGITLPGGVVSISGRVTTQEGVGLSGVILTFSDNLESRSTAADFNGNYRQVLPEGWSGDVIPEKEGYGFGPPIKRYPGLFSHKLDQDYRAAATSPVISGMIANNEGIGIPGVTLIFSGAGGGQTTAASDANGNYHHAVAHGWSGTVTASKEGYNIFSPASTYKKVLSDMPGQDYAAAAFYPVISGRVTTPVDTGFPGVKIEFFSSVGTPGYPYTYTNANGFYIHAVVPGWTGTVTPSKNRHQFDPASYAYENFNSPFPNQDYRALPLISGRVTIPGDLRIEGLEGVKMTFTADSGEIREETTDGDGNYYHSVIPGWSGALKPKKAGHHFSPYSPYYEAVNNDLAGQNFAAGLNRINLILQASRKVEGTLLIRKHYGKINLTFAATIGDTPVSSIESYIIYRVTSSGGLDALQEISASDLPIGGTYTYYHQYLEKNISYTYIARAFDSTGNIIGESNEETI